jgi:hypothetical protein
MGKASNRKKVKRQHVESRQHLIAAPVPMSPAPRIRTVSSLFREGNRWPGPVYRFFKDESHADALARGEIWISTLGECRKYENEMQGDPGEGHMAYQFNGSISGNTSDPEFTKIVRQVGLQTLPGMNIQMRNVIGLQALPDALVLCTSMRFAPEILSKDFGEYCVRINEPFAFFKLVSEELAARYDLLTFGLDSVIYSERKFANFESPPGRVGFVKPERFREQQEARMLWTIDTSAPLTPGLIRIPATSTYCERII